MPEMENKIDWIPPRDNAFYRHQSLYYKFAGGKGPGSILLHFYDNLFFAVARVPC